MENLKVILENGIKIWNEYHEPALEFGTDGSNSTGLKLKDTYRILFYCNKSKAIDVLEFLKSLEREKEWLIERQKN